MSKIFKSSTFILLLGICLLTAACGKEPAKTDSDAYFDIQSETEQIFHAENADFNMFMLGEQFFQGEPVQLWSERVTDENLQATLNIYMYKQDGSRKLLLSGLDSKYRAWGWYIGEDSCFYVPQTGGIVKLDAEGREVFKAAINGSIQGVSQVSPKKISLLIQENKNWSLGELEIATGEISVAETVVISQEDGKCYIGKQENTLLLLNSEGIFKIDGKTGKKDFLLKFKDTAYSFTAATDLAAPTVCDFQVTETGEAQILYNDGTMERLRLVDVSADRTVIRVRVADDDYFVKWFKKQMIQYNRMNETYYVMMEQCDEQTDVHDFRTQTGIQLSTGKAADIICGSAVIGDTGSFLEKGVFEDLAPYMAGSDMREEDYFPVTFDCWRRGEKVYGVSLDVYLLGGFAIDKELLKSDNPDIEELLDALLGVEENAVFYHTYGPEDIVEYCLRGTEDLWGMVDWEEGTCDFGGELFGKILEAAKKYGYSERKNYPDIMTYRKCFMYSFNTRAELEAQGKAVLDYFFDEGCFARIPQNHVFAVNANSSHKEGAWDFLSYMLSEETQSTMGFNGYPVSRKAYDAVIEREYSEGAKVTTVVNGRVSTTIKGGQELTEELVEEIVQTIESAQTFPVRTEPVLEIICEEAGSYFDGSKSREEVCSIITNRVNLYLSERR